MADSDPATPLRSLALRGSMYMAARQGLALVIGVIGVVILTRQIGPSAYGEYVGALTIVAFLTSVARFGVETYLVRRPEPPESRVYGTAFTLLLINGVGATCLALIVAPVAIGFLVGASFVRPFEALVLALPLSLLLAPSLASLEREMRYERVAFVELLNPIVFYGIAVPWAIESPSVWAPVAGYLAAQTASLIATVAVSSIPVRLAWSWNDAREMLHFGTPLTFANAFADGRMLVNPIVVGSMLGAGAVGEVGLALRITDMLRFVSRAGDRVSLAALSRLVGDRDRLSRGVSEGMRMQILAVAPFFCGFAIASSWLVPTLLGPGWNDTVTVFPLIAFGAFFLSLMSLQVSLLFVLGRSSSVLASSIANLLLLAGGSVISIALLDSPIGYGVGEAVACVGLVIVVRATARYVALDYASLAPWLAAAIPPLFFPWLGVPWGLLLCVPAAALLTSRSERARIGQYVRFLRPGSDA